MYNVMLRNWEFAFKKLFWVFFFFFFPPPGKEIKMRNMVGVKWKICIKIYLGLLFIGPALMISPLVLSNLLGPLQKPFSTCNFFFFI